MERSEAEAIYDAGRDAVVDVLLRMDAQIQQLTGRVGRLERELARSSRNSSLPPSSDPPVVKKRHKAARRKGPSGRSQGAQPGHEGKGRGLLETAACDEVVVHWPERCRCGHEFSDGELVVVGDPVRHQVQELPVISTFVTEHQCPRVCCPGCGNATRAELPMAVASSAFGPRLQAAIAVLSVRNRISRRDAVELVAQLFGARISTGTVDQVLTRSSDALTVPYEDLLARVRGGGALNMDETGWRLKGAQRTLWGAFTDRHAVLRIADSRHEEHAKELLGGTRAVITSDRWWAYNHLPLKRRQVCWAPLQRDFQAQAEGLAAEKEFGEAGLAICDRLFQAWQDFQNTGDRDELTRQILRLRHKLKPVLREYGGKAPRYKRTRGLAKNLLKIWPALWTFAKTDGVTPTNNHAERSLRGAVIYRKLSLGSQSESGETRIARLLSAHTTCRLQDRSLFEYLTQALDHHARGAPVPLLA